MHVFQAFLFLEASRKAFQSQRHFVKYKLPSLGQPKDVDHAKMDAEIKADAHAVDQKGVAEPTSLPSSPLGSSISLPTEDGDEIESDDGEVLSDSTRNQDSEPKTSVETSDEEELGWSGARPPRPRPLLRAFASARDLLTMSKATPVLEVETNGRERNHSRSRTSSAVYFQNRDSSHKALHARSSSHPDLRGLLEEYEQSGPSNVTKVFSLYE